LKIIKSYQKKYKFIKLISEKDKGQSDAINKGLKLATGDIIAYLNSDDTYKKNTLITISKFFKKHKEVMWLYGKCDIIDEDDKEILKPLTAYKNFLAKNYSYNKLLV